MPDSPADGLGARATRAASWVVVLQVVLRVVGLVRVVVLARLLDPRDFGLMGVALLVAAMISSITDLGVSPALVQRTGDIEDHLDTAWSINAVRQSVLGAVMFVAAPLAGSFFHAPRAPDVVRALSAVVVLWGFRNVAVVVFERELAFTRIAVLRFTVAATDLVVTVTLAVWLHSVWALVGGAIAGAVADVVCSYAVLPRRPRLEFDRRRAGELMGFGKWVFWGNVATFFATNVDDIFVGRVLGTRSLGFYQVAYRMGSAPTTEIAHLVNEVAFPAYSVLQDEAERLRVAFLRTLRIVGALSLALAAAVCTLAGPFVTAVLGARWAPAVGAARLLGVYGGLRALGAVVGSLLWAVGRPELHFRLLLPEALGMAVLLYPLTHRYGIEGAAAAVLIPSVIMRLRSLGYARRVADLSWSDLARALGPGCAGAAVLAAVAGAAVALIADDAVALVAGAVSSGVALVVVHLVLHRVDPAWAVVDDLRALVANLRASRPPA
jgi:O-antigen/teichoic acid export membrane protein